ncbi:MAG: DNA repair protein RecO [Halanaerobium sp.]|nr:DNA repair protein RecO [Halanaerobium sp.]
MSLLKTDAIILKSWELGEADRIFSVFSRSYGKLRVVAQGVRRTKSRFSGCMQPFSYDHLVIYKGRSIPRVNQCEIKESFTLLREDLSRMAYSSYVAELVDEFTGEEDRNEALFSLLLAALTFIKDGWDLEVVTRNFEIRALSLLGYQPQLHRCVSCGREIEQEEKLGFSPAKGGVLCSTCRSQGFSLQAGSLAFLRKFLEGHSRQLKHMRLPGYAGQELEMLLGKYLEYYLEKPLKSRQFINTLRNLNP